ncbi:unnamed protein product, partial [Prorocentrum cordatum]
QVNALISPACSVPDLVAQLAGCQVKHEQIVALLVKGKVDGNNPAFHTLVRQYMALPAAWHKVPDLLGSERRWTRKFCDTLDDEDAKVLAMTHDTFAFTKLYGLPPATIVEVVGVFLERIGAKGEPEVAKIFDAIKSAPPGRWAAAVDAPFSFGDKVPRTSHLHFQQQRYHHPFPHVRIGHAKIALASAISSRANLAAPSRTGRNESTWRSRVHGLSWGQNG